MSSLALGETTALKAPVPESMWADVIGQIRRRWGLDPRPPTAEEYFEKE